MQHAWWTVTHLRSCARARPSCWRSWWYKPCLTQSACSCASGTVRSQKVPAQHQEHLTEIPHPLHSAFRPREVRRTDHITINGHQPVTTHLRRPGPRLDLRQARYINLTSHRKGGRWTKRRQTRPRWPGAARRTAARAPGVKGTCVRVSKRLTWTGPEPGQASFECLLQHGRASLAGCGQQSTSYEHGGSPDSHLCWQSHRLQNSC